MPDFALEGIPEFEGIEPIGELPGWTIQRAIENTDNHVAWAYEFVRQVPGADAIFDWAGNILVYTPDPIVSLLHPRLEPGWYYLNQPQQASSNDWA